MKKLKVLSLCLALCLLMGLSAAYADDGSLTGLPSPFRFDSLAGLKGEEWANAAIEKNAAALATYQAKRFTTANGVTVQRVPNDMRAYNVAVLNAEQRGCNNCHALNTMLEMLPMSHPQLANEYDSTDLSVEMCFTCHKMINHGDVVLADSMHALHMYSDSFTEDMNGNCLSCHHIDQYTSEYELWDRVKYSVMKGITKVAAQDVVANITYVQDKITPTEDIYLYWEDDQKYGIPATFDTSDEALANWNIAVTGEVEATINAKEFIEKYEQYAVTDIRMLDCCVGGIGSNQVAQCEVKGIPAEYFMQEAGYAIPEGKAAVFNTVGSDGMKISVSPYANETLFVYEINGERLSAALGFPMQIWQATGAAPQFTKAPVSIEIVTADAPAPKGYQFNAPNCGIFNYRDGQVFKMGDKIVFEGYANSALDGTYATKVEYSFDLGETWIELDTTESDPNQYIYWYLDFEPQTIGSYVLTIRATNNLGTVQSINVQSLFHVE
ncbi:MAG: molybdopterin-dependent oxidoreductase [Clostridia bacterium]|nr:molybdopterin-dependent oxidoreductase [Clostridia bacterium]